MKRILFALAALLVLAAGCTQEVDPTSVRLDQHELTLPVGETVTLEATIAPSNATNTAVGWSSSKPSVADVDKDGKVTALSEGMTSITVATRAGGLTDACIVTVTSKPVPVTGVKLDKTEIEITEGDAYQLTAAVEPVNATNQTVSWSSSDEEVASVDNLGYVHAHSEGTVTITVKTEDGGFTAKCEVTVLKYTIPVVGVWVQPNELTLQKGETATLQWYVDPESATDRSVKFTSSDTKVATVSDEGVVTAVDYGTATVTITTVDGGFTDECEVTVAAVVEGVTIAPASVELAEGQSVQLSASVSPEGAPQEVEWASFDTNIASVDANGLVTAVAAGTTRISARSKEYPDKQGFCEVTVTQDNSLKGISLTPTELTLTVGQSQTLTVLYTPEHAANKKVSWTTSNGDVATVSAEGKVVALSVGTATITATSEEGGFTASCAVTISETEGIKVYYVDYYAKDILYVNGAPDPRSGAFDVHNESLSREYRSIRSICEDGHDLFTVELYYYQGETLHYLCKNRNPLYIIDFDSNEPDNILSISAKDGTVAMVTKSWEGGEHWSIIRIAPDGTTTRCLITGTFKWMRDKLDSGIAADGTLYVATSIRDAFYHNWLALYELSTDGTLTETLLRENYDYIPVMDISEQGDIYILADCSPDGIILYQNGKEYANLGTYVNSNGLCIRSAGGHTYTAILHKPAEDSYCINVKCDGTTLRELNVGKQTFDLLINPLHVTDAGDIYIALKHSIYKNDNVLYSLPDGAIHLFCVME